MFLHLKKKYFTISIKVTKPVRGGTRLSVSILHCACERMCTHIWHLTYRSSINGHLDGFPILATVNNAATNTRSGCLCELLFLCSSDKSPAVGLLDHMVVAFLVFWGNSILFSTEAAPLCIPTNSVLGFPFLQTLSNTCCLLICLWWPFWLVWSGISLWF